MADKLTFEQITAHRERLAIGAARVIREVYGSDPSGADIHCRDCGEVGELTGHMGCQYPSDNHV